MKAAPAVLVIMGVAGAGKTTVAELLAARLQWPLRDGDSFHPSANVDKMRAGDALNDVDRAPWLAAIAAWIDAQRDGGAKGIVTCSALKRRYRDRLIGTRADVRLVYLKGEEILIAARMNARTGHFMPPALLPSQFAALEEPAPEEDAITVTIDDTPEAIAAAVLAELTRAP